MIHKSVKLAEQKASCVITLVRNGHIPIAHIVLVLFLHFSFLSRDQCALQLLTTEWILAVFIQWYTFFQLCFKLLVVLWSVFLLYMYIWQYILASSRIIFSSNAIDPCINMRVHNLAVLASYGRVKESVHFRVNHWTHLVWRCIMLQPWKTRTHKN